MITMLAIISFGIWVYLLGFHGSFWRSGPVLANRIPSGTAKIAVVIPARDEAANIRQALKSLLAQDYAGQLAIILVDDNSSDGTGSIAAAMGDGISVIQGKPLPPGWSGKMWAVSQGLTHEDAMAADYVLLTDADIEHAPSHISALVAKAELDGLDLVSEMVRLNCATFAERALIPAFVFFFQLLYPFIRASDPEDALSGAAGGTMLVSRAALNRIDGVSRIKHCLIDDCALAKEIKAGGKIWLGHSETAVSLRVYEDISDIWNMVARTAYVQLKHSPLLLAGTVLGMFATYIVPMLAVIGAHGLALILGVFTWLMMAYAFQPTLRRYQRSPLWGFALPLIGSFYGAATIASAFCHYTGRGGGWKNRVYPEAAT